MNRPARYGEGYKVMCSKTAEPTGDQVWKELDLRYRAKMISFFRRRGCTLDEADDLTQEVLIRIYSSKSFAAILHIDWLQKAFIYKVAANYFCTWIVKNKKEPQGLEGLSGSADDRETFKPFWASPSPDPAKTNIHQEYLEEMIQHLTADERTILILFHRDGYTFKEIGEAMGKAEGTVKNCASKARLKLRAFDK